MKQCLMIALCILVLGAIAPAKAADWDQEAFGRAPESIYQTVCDSLSDYWGKYRFRSDASPYHKQITPQLARNLLGILDRPIDQRMSAGVCTYHEPMGLPTGKLAFGNGPQVVAMTVRVLSLAGLRPEETVRLTPDGFRNRVQRDVRELLVYVRHTEKPSSVWIPVVRRAIAEWNFDFRDLVSTPEQRELIIAAR